jgi:hypothetical protein
MFVLIVWCKKTRFLRIICLRKLCEFVSDKIKYSMFGKLKCFKFTSEDLVLELTPPVFLFIHFLINTLNVNNSNYLVFFKGRPSLFLFK